MGYELQNFEEEVLKASHIKPVLVDFWAPWCGPCRTLGPIIEKLAAENPETWTLVKINSDDHQELSQQYGVKGIPAVKLFHNGEVIDEFTGVLPEYAIVQWLEKALPSKAKDLLKEAEDALEMDNPSEAKHILESALKLEPTHPTACGLLAGLLVFEDAPRAAELAVTAATGEVRFLPLRSAIEEIVGAVEKIGSNPNKKPNLSEEEPGVTAYLAALRCVKNGEPEEAFPLLIDVLKTNRYLDDDGARKLGVALFTVLGADHRITQKYRRTFDMWLY